MTNFEIAFTHIIDVEGGDIYTNRKADRGGPTKYGISHRVYSEFKGYETSAQDVKHMTKEEAKLIYKRRYWDVMRLDGLSLPLAIVLFDIGVNRGPATAVKNLQKVIGSGEDGILGPKTKEMIAVMGEEKAMWEFLKECMRDYIDIARSDETQLANLKGWINRVLHLMELFAVA